MNVLEWVVVVPVAAVGAIILLGVLGLAIDTVSEDRIQHDRCLKQATNGYDIRRCR